jgi:hypothetical protein
MGLWAKNTKGSKQFGKATQNLPPNRTTKQNSELETLRKPRASKTIQILGELGGIFFHFRGA